MIYRRDKQIRKKRMFLQILILVIILTFILWTPLRQKLTNGLMYVSIPAWAAGNAAGDYFKGTLKLFTEKQKLAEENEILKKQVQEMSLKILDRNLLWEENVELRERLGREAYDELKVVGHVLAGPGRSAYDTLIVDVGSNSGIEAGDVVLYANSIVVGEVAEVYGASSKIKLYSSPGETLEVVVGPNSIPADATGRGAGNFEIKLPRDTDVSIGDPIRTPSGFLRMAGVVEHIGSLPNDPFKTILFKNPVNIFEIEWVEIVKSGI